MAKKHKPAPAPQVVAKKQGWTGKIGDALIDVSAKTGNRRLETWIRSYFNPEEMLPELGKKAGVKKTVSNLLLFYFPYYAIVFLTYSVSFFAMGTSQTILGEGVKNPLDPAFAGSMLLVEPLLSTLNMMIVMLFIFAPAKLLGGKADYARQSYAISNLFAGWMAILAAIMVLATVEIVAGSFFSAEQPLEIALSFAASLSFLITLVFGAIVFAHGFYQLYRLIKSVHGFSGLRAALSMVCAAILVVILNVILLSLLGPN
ncbi:MAG: hypothetical protein WCT52_05620 [Candidatus Micrarchaeia archaeon]